MHRVPSHDPVASAVTRRRGFHSVSVQIQQAIGGRRPKPAARPVGASVVFEDSTVAHVLLMGDDCDRFNKIRDYLDYDMVSAISISDQDGPAAIGWIQEQGSNTESKPNKLASDLADRFILGPMVVTGLGQGNQASMTSIHQGLQLVLDRLARTLTVEDTNGDEQRAGDPCL
jgi:hypothetical protein